MYEYSLRFFPFWDKNNITQLTGFINLIEYIFDKNTNASHWVEIGSFLGESSSIILGFDKVKSLHCIDFWENLKFDYLKDADDLNKKIESISPSSKTVFYNRLKKHIETGRCTPIDMESKLANRLYQANSIDVIYIDADHSYEAVMSDLTIWFDKIKSGGFICGHDYKTEKNVWPGVTKAVDDFIEQNFLDHPITFDDSSFLIQKP